MTSIRNWFIVGGLINLALVFAMFIVVLKVINKYDPFLKREKKKKKKKKKAKKEKKKEVKRSYFSRDTSMDSAFFGENNSESTYFGSSIYDDYGTATYSQQQQQQQIPTATMSETASMTATATVTSSTTATKLQTDETRLLETLAREMLERSNEYEDDTGSSRYYSNIIVPACVPLVEKKWLEYINDHRKEYETGISFVTTTKKLRSLLMGNNNDDGSDDDETDDDDEDEDEEENGGGREKEMKNVLIRYKHNIQFYIDVINRGTNFLHTKKYNNKGMFQLFTRKKFDNLFNQQDIKKQENSLILSTGLIPTLLKSRRRNITFDKIKEVLKMYTPLEGESNKITIIHEVKTIFSGFDAENNCLDGMRKTQLVDIVLCNVGTDGNNESLMDAYMGAYLAAVNAEVKSLFLVLLEEEGFSEKAVYSSIWNGFKKVALNKINKTLEEVHVVVYEVSGELATFYNFLSNNDIDVKIYKD